MILRHHDQVDKVIHLRVLVHEGLALPFHAHTVGNHRHTEREVG